MARIPRDVNFSFDPGEGHDQSFHASDKMVPRTVVISQGGSVTFSITPPHQLAIYGPGTFAVPATLTFFLLTVAMLPSGYNTPIAVTPK